MQAKCELNGRNPEEASPSKPKHYTIRTVHQCPKFGKGCCLDIGLAELAIRGEASVVCCDCQQGPETR